MKLKRLLKRLVLLFLGIFVFGYNTKAQIITLKGKISDEKGLSIPGASVKIKGTHKGTITNAEGIFTIDCSGPVILSVSAIGYTAKEVKISNTSNVNIILAEDNKTLGEVVVTALGIKRDKKVLTYSSQEIKGTDLVQGKDPNLVNDIDGKVSGVQITSASGSPGSSTRIVVRGASYFMETTML